jgi:hypothetical protein
VVRRLGACNLAFGALLVWVVLCALSTRFLPGGAYLFTWPTLTSLIALGAIFARRPARKESGQLPMTPTDVTALWLGALPGLLLVAPIVYLLFVAMTLALPMSLGSLIFAGLLLGLLVPHGALIARWGI